MKPEEPSHEQLRLPIPPKSSTDDGLHFPSEKNSRMQLTT